MIFYTKTRRRKEFENVSIFVALRLVSITGSDQRDYFLTKWGMSNGISSDSSTIPPYSPPSNQGAW